MVNIGEKYSNAPEGLVTSVGFAALGKVFYGFEGNIHCTGMTVSWLVNELKLISDASQIEEIATSVENNAGVYFVPAFAGLGAPWWRPKAKAVISGLSLGTAAAGKHTEHERAEDELNHNRTAASRSAPCSTPRRS